MVGAESYGRVPSPTLEGKLLAEGKEAMERTYRKRRWTEDVLGSIHRARGSMRVRGGVDG